MNTDNNRRFQETEDKIIKVCAELMKTEDPLKITVSRICQEAGIHRTTFYGHFQDMPDVLAAVQQKGMQKMFRCFLTEDGWNLEEGLCQQMKFIYKYRKIVRRHMEREGVSLFYQGLFSWVQNEQYREAYKKQFHLTTDQELTYHKEYLTGGMTSLIRKWVETDCKETPETIVAYILKFGSIDNNL